MTIFLYFHIIFANSPSASSAFWNMISIPIHFTSANSSFSMISLYFDFGIVSILRSPFVPWRVLTVFSSISMITISLDAFRVCLYIVSCQVPFPVRYMYNPFIACVVLSGVNPRAINKHMRQITIIEKICLKFFIFFIYSILSFILNICKKLHFLVFFEKNSLAHSSLVSDFSRLSHSDSYESLMRRRMDESLVLSWARFSHQIIGKLLVMEQWRIVHNSEEMIQASLLE